MQNDVLGSTAFNVLDYGARYYDPVIGRFTEPDPLAELSRGWSSYNYCFNNPLRFIDPSGMTPENPEEGDYDDETNTYYSYRFGWVTSQFYSFLGQGGYNYKNNQQVVDAFMSTFEPDCGNEEKQDEQNTNQAPVYKDYYADALSKLADVGGAVMPFVPLVGPIYSYSNDQIYGDASMPLTLLWIALDALPASKAFEWTFGSFKSEAKWVSQLAKRGWTTTQITEAITKGKRFKAINNVNKANGATRYVHPTTGKSVVIDNVTKELLQVGGAGFKW